MKYVFAPLAIVFAAGSALAGITMIKPNDLPTNCPAGWVKQGTEGAGKLTCVPSAPLLACPAGSTIYSSGSQIGCKAP